MYIALLIVLFGGSVAGFFIVTSKTDISPQQKMQYLVIIGCLIGLIGGCNELFKHSPVSAAIGDVVSLEIQFYEGNKLQNRKKYELEDFSKTNLLVEQDIFSEAGKLNEIFSLNGHDYYQRFYLIYGEHNSGLTYNIKRFCQKIQNEQRVPFLFKSISSQIREDMSKKQILESLDIYDFDALIESIKSFNLQYKTPLLVIDNIEYAFDSESGYFFLSDILQTISSLTKTHIFLLTTSLSISTLKDQNLFMSQNIESKRLSLLSDASRVTQYLKELSLDQEIDEVEVEQCTQIFEFSFEDISNIKQKNLSLNDYCQSVKQDESSLGMSDEQYLKLIEIQCSKYDKDTIQECKNMSVNYNMFRSKTKVQEADLNNSFIIQNGQIRFGSLRKFNQALYYYMKVKKYIEEQ